MQATINSCSRVSGGKYLCCAVIKTDKHHKKEIKQKKKKQISCACAAWRATAQVNNSREAEKKILIRAVKMERGGREADINFRATDGCRSLIN